MNKMEDTRGSASVYQSAQTESASAYSIKMKKQRISGKKRKSTKKLNYNHKEISIMLMRSTQSQSAASVLVLAKNRLGNLKSCAVTGEYNRKEVANAIAHAERMVRCAQLKIKNLKEEEAEKLQNKRNHNSREQKSRSAVKARVRLKKRQLEQKASSEELKRLQKQKLEYERLEKKRRRHRNEEYGKIKEADIKYCQGQRAAGTAATSFFPPGPAAVLELTREQKSLDEQKLEQQAEKELGGSSEHTSGTAPAASPSAPAADIPAETAGTDFSVAGGSVDVMV